MGNEKDNQESGWGRFWTRFRKPDGELTTAVSFDENEFQEDFGDEALNAVRDLRHYTGNFPDRPDAQARLQQARENLSNLGIDPDDLIAGKTDANIEDV